MTAPILVAQKVGLEQRPPARRVLVVERQALLRELLAETLRFLGQSVETAGDCASGLRLAAATRPDLVLFDLDALSLEVKRVYREFWKRGVPSSRIVLMGCPASCQKIGDWVGLRLLTKPVELQDLLVALLR